MYIAYVWGVFSHECIVLWVVKTTLLSFPVEYAIASIVYSIHVLTINPIFILQANFFLVYSKVTSTCTLCSLTYLQESTCARSLLIAARDLAHVLNIFPVREKRMTKLKNSSIQLKM